MSGNIRLNSAPCHPKPSLTKPPAQISIFPSFLTLISEDAVGGWKKDEGGKPHEGHPSEKGVLDPPRTVSFPPPLRCQCSVFPVQKSTTEQTRSSFGEVQKFSGERVLWYVFLPPYVLHPPPISRPNDCPHVLHCFGCIFAAFRSFSRVLQHAQD